MICIFEQSGQSVECEFHLIHFHGALDSEMHNSRLFNGSVCRVDIPTRQSEAGNGHRAGSETGETVVKHGH